jgi:hypothetical protein
MCFSAGASFTSGAVLATIGAVALKSVRKPSQRMFAFIPILFAIQQITEGCLWLSLSGNASALWQPTATFIFLSIAQIAWPIWVPLSILLFEKEKSRKKILKVMTAIGILVGGSIAYCLFFYPVHSRIEEHHILYELDFPLATKIYGGAFYFIATVLPPFVSSAKLMKALAFLILISYIITAIFYENYVISVWCFFAAIMSAVVYLVVREDVLNPEIDDAKPTIS